MFHNLESLQGSQIWSVKQQLLSVMEEGTREVGDQGEIVLGRPWLAEEEMMGNRIVTWKSGDQRVTVLTCGYGNEH